MYIYTLSSRVINARLKQDPQSKNNLQKILSFQQTVVQICVNVPYCKKRLCTYYVAQTGQVKELGVHVCVCLSYFLHNNAVIFLG